MKTSKAMWAVQWLRTQALHDMSETGIMMLTERRQTQKEKLYILIPLTNLGLKMCALGWQDSSA